jgi:hypothetical protein
MEHFFSFSLPLSLYHSPTHSLSLSHTHSLSNYISLNPSF